MINRLDGCLFFILLCSVISLSYLKQSCNVLLNVLCVINDRCLWFLCSSGLLLNHPTTPEKQPALPDMCGRSHEWSTRNPNAHTYAPGEASPLKANKCNVFSFLSGVSNVIVSTLVSVYTPSPSSFGEYWTDRFSTVYHLFFPVSV